jgi:dimethylaniline monooxygenase (N-oxide forming)
VPDVLSVYIVRCTVLLGVCSSSDVLHVQLQVYLSTRRGSWVINRVWDGGVPAALVNHSQFRTDLRKILPRWLANSLIERKINAKFNHALYGLQPDHRFDAQHPMVNDDLPNAIIAGRVIVKSNVRRLTETGVEFEDGSVVDNIDVVIYATGYVFGFPYIDHKALTVVNNDVNFYKFVFPPDIQPSTLAVIGCIQPVGAIFPISELQCRWVVRVFKVGLFIRNSAVFIKVLACCKAQGYVSS